MRKSHIILAGAAALSLTACSATTGSAAKSQAQQKTTLQEPMKQEASVTQAEPTSLDSNSNMDCATLEAKITEADAQMDEARKVVMGQDKEAMSDKVSQMALNQGASRALKSIPFGGLLAKSAIKSAGSSKEQKVEIAKTNFNEANLRRANLSGLYAGKNCGS